MPHATTESIDLCYESQGETTSPTVLLIAGQSAQLTSWPPSLVRMLVDTGHRVVTFDNRDVGLSFKFADQAQYDLSDMAQDAVSLLEHLDVKTAHIVGQSMGGMIAQQLCIDHPDRALSLCSFYSAPNPDYITDSPKVWEAREQPPATDREGAVRQYIERERVSGLQEYSEDWIRNYAEQAVDRSWYPEGAQRQMAAVRRSPDRTEGLKNLAIPAAVIHGLADRLITADGGIATAEAIPDADLHLYASMPHQLLPSLFEHYAQIIRRTVRRGEARSGTAGQGAREHPSSQQERRSAHAVGG